MTPVLVTVASRTKNTKRFMDSLDNLNAEHISIEFMPFINADAAYMTYNMKYVGHIRRFYYIPTIDLGEYVIFSDTDDVIFQKDLPNLSNAIKKYDIYVGNERILHRDTIWKDVIEPRPAFHHLLDKTVYNAGLFCMKRPLFNEYVSFIKGYIDRHENVTGWGDQLLLNYFIHRNRHSVYDGVELFCPLYANLDQGLVEKKDGVWKVTKTGEVIVAIHENGIKERL